MAQKQWYGNFAVCWKQVRKVDPFSGRFVLDKDGGGVQWIGNNNSTIAREPYNYVDPDGTEN